MGGGHMPPVPPLVLTPMRVNFKEGKRHCNSSSRTTIFVILPYMDNKEMNNKCLVIILFGFVKCCILRTVQLVTKAKCQILQMPEVICEGIHSHIVVPTLHIVSSNMVSHPDYIGGMKSGLGMRPIKILQKPIKIKIRLSQKLNTETYGHCARVEGDLKGNRACWQFPGLNKAS